MSCPFCRGTVPLPLVATVTTCTGCGRSYKAVADLGFFTYSVLLFVPVAEKC